MIFNQRLALLTLSLALPILTGFGPSRPVPLPAPEPQIGFTTAPRADVFRLWLDSRTGSTPKVWLGTDTDNLATAGVQVWDNGPIAREVYSTRDASLPPGNGRTELTAIGFQGDRTFVAVRGGPGARPTKGGSWIESSDRNGPTDWQVEFTASNSWNFLVRGIEVLASGEVMAWGTSDFEQSCGGNGLLAWTAVRDSNGNWSQTKLPNSFCNEVPLGILASVTGRDIWLLTQSGVLLGEAGSQSWQRTLQWSAGNALQGKTQSNSAVLLFNDGSLRQWRPGTQTLQFIANSPAGALLPAANQARWYAGRSGWDATGSDSAAWVTSGYKQRVHCHQPIIIIPMPGPVGNPCVDLISHVWTWNGQAWKLAASTYGNSISGVFITGMGTLLMPEHGMVKTLRLTP